MSKLPGQLGIQNTNAYGAGALNTRMAALEYLEEFRKQ